METVREQSKSDRGINLANFNAMIRAIKARIRFDPSDFITRDSGVGGVLVSLRKGAASPDEYSGELWVQGNHYYDNTNFSPDNTNGTEITGTYSGAVWIQINLSAGTVAYSATGPAGATWGDDIVWRRLSECGGSGQYILC